MTCKSRLAAPRSLRVGSSAIRQVEISSEFECHLGPCVARCRCAPFLIRIRRARGPHAQAQVSTYRTSLDSVAADLTKAKQKFNRSSLLGGGASGRPLEFDKSADQRSRMANTTDKLRGGTDQLDAAHRQLEETLDVGESRCSGSLCM